MWVQFLGWEDTLEEMATHSSILAWETPWTEEPGRLQSTGLHRVRHDQSSLAHMHAWVLWGEVSPRERMSCLGTVFPIRTPDAL